MNIFDERKFVSTFRDKFPFIKNDERWEKVGFKMEIHEDIKNKLAMIDKLSIKVGMKPIEFMDVLGLLPPCPATTIEEAYILYYNSQIDSPESRSAIFKWNQFSLIEVAAATTIEEAKNARDKSPKGSAAERAATLKIFELYQEGQ